MAIPHDTYLLTIFGDPRLFAALLRHHLGEELAAKLDWDSLCRHGERHTGLRLQSGVVDLVYSIVFLDRSARLLPCFEHRSTPHHDIHDTLLRYTVHLLHRSRRERPPLPTFVLAMLLSHGGSRPLLPRAAADTPPSQHEPWLRFQPRVEILVDALDAASEAELRVRALPPAATLALLAVRSLPGLDRDSTLAALDRWADLLVAADAEDQRYDSDHLAQFLWYMLMVNETPAEDVQMAIENHLPRIRGTLMTTGEKLLERGRVEGRVEGKVEGRAEGLRAGRAATLRRLLTRRFGPLPTALEARIEQATTDELDGLADRMFDATSLAEVFAGPRA